MIRKLVNLTDKDFDSIVFRYLTFSKFISMVTYQALWFPKLNILQDTFEGGLPFLAERIMRENHAKWKGMFDTPELRAQIDNWPNKNVENGRELAVVNCWFLGDVESSRMWEEYVGIKEGVAIKSTIKKLMQYVDLNPDPHISQIGKVDYIDFNKYTINSYRAAQVFERAFLKNNKYCHEQEVRIATMNWKHLGCVSMEGRPFTTEQCSGINMNNFENPGLYVRVNFEKLVDAVILAPNAPVWLENLIRRIFELSKLNIPIEKSKIEIAEQKSAGRFFRKKAKFWWGKILPFCFSRVSGSASCHPRGF